MPPRFDVRVPVAVLASPLRVRVLFPTALAPLARGSVISVGCSLQA
jgi:hypothetical protein